MCGTLNVTAGGAITDSGNVVVTGTTTLAAGAGNDITLDNANNFQHGIDHQWSQCHAERHQCADPGSLDGIRYVGSDDRRSDHSEVER